MRTPVQEDLVYFPSSTLDPRKTSSVLGLSSIDILSTGLLINYGLYLITYENSKLYMEWPLVKINLNCCDGLCQEPSGRINQEEDNLFEVFLCWALDCTSWILEVHLRDHLIHGSYNSDNWFMGQIRMQKTVI